MFLFRRVGPTSRRCSLSLLCSSQYTRQASSTAYGAAADVLKNHSTALPVEPQNVHVLREPCDFYRTLKRGILSAKRRISLASLYIGTEEADLINALTTALNTNGDLKVSILLDGLRGTRLSRQAESSVTLLTPLLEAFPGRMTLSLYRTPDLPSWMVRHAPPRFHEIAGVMHAKAMIFDDSILLTGANLSHDYFTHRQDRYHLFNHSPEVANYYQGLIDTLSACSFSTNRSADLLPPKSIPHPHDNSEAFRREATAHLEAFIRSYTPSQTDSSGVRAGTWLFPTIQAAPLHIHQDQRCLLDLIHTLSSSDLHIALTSGYFNLDDPLQAAILASKSAWDLLIASPEANGFFTAKDIARHVPNVYTNQEYAFQQRVERASRDEMTRFHEYRRAGWTFHAKGMWFSSMEGNADTVVDPFLTTIGSPNYGYRSTHKDIEGHAFVLSDDPVLRADWGKECRHLFGQAGRATTEDTGTKERRGPYWVQKVSPILRKYF